MEPYVLKLDQLGMGDVEVVGGKNASLGEMISNLGSLGVDVPGGFADPATALPVQIYLWADSPERAFAERTSAAIIVLLGFLLVMNLTAVILRKRMERKW